jgi:hypothetical protein
MTVRIDFHMFGIRVRPSAETNDHEVRLIGDEDDLIDRFWDGMIGLDPDDILVEPCRLRPSGHPHAATIARCECGVIGCGSVEVEVRSDGDGVLWIEENRTLRFSADQYLAEIRRAQADTTWETADRTAARLVRAGVPSEWLTKNGLSFEWASGRTGSATLTVSLRLEPGPYQVLVSLPWRNQAPEEVAQSMLRLLQEEPRAWRDVRYSPFRTDLPEPPLIGPGWRRGAGS